MQHGHGQGAETEEAAAEEMVSDGEAEEAEEAFDPMFA